MGEGRNKKFAKDIMIYGFGSLGSKFVTFLIFPLYTFFVTPDNLGYYDISLTTIIFAIPFVSLQLRDGVFRFLIDSKSESSRKAIISQSYMLVFAMMIFVSVLVMITSLFIEIRCSYYILGLLLTMSFYEVQIQIVRGLGHTKLFILCGLLTATLIAIFSIIFIVYFKWDIEGIFISNILSRLLVLSFLEIKKSVIARYFSIHILNAATVKTLLKYCFPLILSTSFIWLIHNSNKYFIIYYEGLYTNGIYAAVTKFSQIIEIIAVVVFQAWQETSVLQLNSKDRDQYYSSILSSYLLVLTGIVISVSFVLKTAYPSLVEAQYAIGTKYLYIIFIAEIGFSLQFFMSAIFQALKNTKQTLYTTLASAVISIILNYFLIRFFSLMGAAVAFGLSYFFMFASYLIAARKYLRIGLSAKSVIFSLLLLATGGLIFYYTDNILWRIVFWITSSILIITALPKSVISDIKHYFQSFQQQTHNNRS